MLAGHGLKITASIAIIMIFSALPLAQQQPDPNTQPTPLTPLSSNEGLETGPLVVPGAAPDLAIMYTGNVAGLVSPCG